MRDRSSRVYALVRRWTVEAGRRLAARGELESSGDVWMLRREEVLSGLDGAVAPGVLAGRARDGRGMIRSFRNFESPNEIGSSHGFAPRASTANGKVLHGSACSPGRVRGPARVVRRIEDAGRVRPGDVLVAPFTDPGWTPVFPRIAAVVTETGGLLSHAAVIARECGIPAVLAVRDATRTIRDGDVIEVDGHRGTVQLE
jgi:pyruvate,water dikinase